MAQSAVAQRLGGLFDFLVVRKWSLLATALALACADLWWNGEKRAAKKRIKSGSNLLFFFSGRFQSDKMTAQESEPGLFKKYSTFESYTTSRATYPRIRTFYKEHYEASKLPTDLPLLVKSNFESENCTCD